jgi:general nucleoside transport system permease protein
MLSQLRLGNYLSYLIGILASLILFSVILLAFGYQPLPNLEGLATGSFGTTFLASETFVLMAPLLLAALAFLVPFRARFYNIGVEGQIYVGALATYLAASQLGGVPSFAAIPIVIVSAALGGTLWLALPLVMRIKLNVNEIFPTLVMNFVAIDLVNWLTAGPIKAPGSANLETPFLPRSTWLPVIPGTALDLGVFVAFVAAFLVYFVVYRTILGFEIRASGANPRAAKGGGINVSRSILAVGLISGSLAGLAGMVVVAGQEHLLAQNFSPGYGYNGISVSALGAFHPIGSTIAAVLYSALWIGGEGLQRSYEAVPIQLVFALQAIIVLSVLVVQRLFDERRARGR